MTPKQRAQLLKEKSNLVLGELKKLEPADNEVFSYYMNEIKTVYENKDFSISMGHSTNLLGVRSICNGRLGFMTTNSLEDAALRDAAREVQGVARLSPPSPFHQIAEKNNSPEYTEVHDSKMSEMAPKELLNYAQQVIEVATKDSRVSIDRAEVSMTQAVWHISNSKGVSHSASQCSTSFQIMGMAKSGSEVTSFDYDGATVSALAQIEPEIKRSIGQFRDSVIGTLGAKKGKTYLGRVILHPYAVINLIGDFVSTNCNGIRHQDGMSSWKEKVGQSVASQSLTIFEDPLNQNRPEGWTPFDREGVARGKHELIKKGQLNFVAHNCFSAKRGEVKPTGNASGGPRSLPGLGFSNMTVLEEKDGPSTESLYKTLGTGLLVKRFSGNSDPISGRFSGVAKNSSWIENGERAHAVQEVMISGNLFDVVRNIVAVGGVSHHLIGGGLAPYIIIDGVSVTAG